ncbi:MAG TPA: glycosyltransferase N-terminal domain-containing protein [Bacteroidia bacterium]|jgi:3-deoxy-D-manno-octulosonic-acid transferase
MRALYSFSINCYRLLITAASLFNPKAKQWVKGRKNLFPRLESDLKLLKKNGSEVIWFHCASLGEFEQGRPLIEKYKEIHPSALIVLTFFSPSGYEVRKNYKGADIICYLPADTISNARKFIWIIKPEKAFFVKYEFWFNYLHELKTKNIPTYLVSGIFRDGQHFFKPYGSWFRSQLKSFTHFFLQDQHSLDLLDAIDFKNTTVAGDTRFDRVAAIAETVKSIDLIKDFSGGRPIFIGGSTWPEDEKIIAASGLKENFKVIIAPHEVHSSHITFIENEFQRNSLNTLCFSKADKINVSTADVLIIDNIGMLSSLYQYAVIAYIGGGFGKGIHNILEAATFGMPVIFGPNYEKFTEAKELIRAGGAFTISDGLSLDNILALLKDGQVLKMASHVSKHYVQSRKGATNKILEKI